VVFLLPHKSFQDKKKKTMKQENLVHMSQPYKRMKQVNNPCAAWKYWDSFGYKREHITRNSSHKQHQRTILYFIQNGNEIAEV
jgi:hypothetical protein